MKANSAYYHTPIRNRNMDKLIITPKTKVYDLLEAYPQLEDTLIEMAPQFSKLKNPVLRKTITRITTLSQAAIVGGLNVEDMLNRFRSIVGQDKVDSLGESGQNYNTIRPHWFTEQHIAKSIDIREMLNKGEQPVHEVLSELRTLSSNQILEVIAPFIPAPLLDKSLSLNYKHWLNEVSKEEYRVYFCA